MSEINCKICNRKCKNILSLSMHITRAHNIKPKEYYDKYLSSNNESLCKLCKNNITRFMGIKDGYHIICESCGKKKSLETYKILYGNEEGIKKYNHYINNSAIKGATLEYFIKQFGETEGKIRYNKLRQSQKGRFTKSWFINKYGIEKGEIKYLNFTKNIGTSLGKFIKKYGDVEGRKKYKKWCEKCSVTISHFIKKYGDIEGRRLYKEKISKSTPTLENFIRINGKEIGRKKYNEFRKSSACDGNPSKESLKIFIPLIEYLIDNKICDINDIFIGKYKNKKEFVLNKNNRYYSYDFTIISLKIIIEYNGEHIHPNPTWINEDEDKWNKWKQLWTNKNSEEVRLFDQNKLNLAIEKGFSVLEIWNSESIDNNIKKCKEFINEKIDEKNKII